MTGTRPRALRGEQVRLRPFRREDLPRVIAWRRDEELRRGALWSEAAFGPREAQRWLRAVSDGADGSRVTLAAIRPTAAVEMFHAPQLRSMAEEVEAVMLKIMDEAAA